MSTLEAPTSTVEVPQGASEVSLGTLEAPPSMLEFSAAPQGIRSRLGAFFYSPEVPYGLALMRIALPIALLFAMVPRWPYAREIFSTDGAPISMWAAYETKPLIPDPNGTMAVATHSLLLLVLVTSCLGWCTRLSLTLATSTYIYLNMLDIIGTMNKYSVIAANLMFLLCFSQCGTIWSVDNWIRRRRLKMQGMPAALADAPRKSSAASRRLLQLFIAGVYLGAAATKLRIPAYFTGEQIQTWMITQYNAPNMFGYVFAMHPSLLVAFSYIGLAWETLFIFLSWRGLGRIVMLGMGVIFHTMTWLTLGLWVFPLVCFSAYLAYLNEADVERMRTFFANRRGLAAKARSLVARVVPRLTWRLPALSPLANGGVFAGLALLTSVAGVGLEYKLDRYGVRRPEGPYALREIDTDRVAEMLGPTRRVRNEDKVLLFDVGSVLVGGAVLDRRTQFHQGEQVRIQCNLIPPHEDMWIECNLHDAENRLVDSIGIVLSAESMQSLFYYQLGDCILPGEYSLVLKIAGDEIMRRPITILPRTNACLAN